MKNRTWLSRILAVTLAVVLVLPAVGLSSFEKVYAEGGEQTTTEAVETPVPEGKTPVSETETPVPEGKTPVPEAETPAPETEAPDSARSARSADEVGGEAETFANVTIKSEDDLMGLVDVHGNKCFQDKAWRTAVFDAVKDGQYNATGSTLYEALANFTGDIAAKNKGIVDVHGIDLLRKANLINLSKNEIVDLSYLGQNSGDPNYKEWFGLMPSLRV